MKQVSEVPKFSIEEYLKGKILRRTLQLYYGVLFMMFVYLIPMMLFFVTMILGLLLKWSMTTILLTSVGSCSAFVVLIAIYHSIISKRYLGYIDISSLYVTPENVYSIEWLPASVKSEKIEVDGKTYYFNEVVNHPDSDLPYLIVITDGVFDISGGEMLKTHRDFKFYRGVRCPVTLAYSTLVELRCADLGIYPSEELEEKIPVPICYMLDGWYFHSRLFRKMGRVGLPENPELWAKAIKVFDELHAREYKEKCELLTKRIEELQAIDRDYKAMAKELYSHYVQESKIFGKPRTVAVSRWARLSKTKKLSLVLILAVLVAIAIILIASVF